MKIVAISDTHGNYDFTIESSNILCICGDIVPLRMQRNIPQSISWFKKEFIPWCKSLPVEQIYMVGGNHDFFLEKEEKKCKELLLGTNITLLNNERAEYFDGEKTWVIWGSPLCHIFGNWAFMYSDEYEKEKFSLMPDEFDVLLTHDAAFGRNDVLLEPYYTKEHIGNPALAQVLEIKHPKYHFTGHLHSTSHILTDYNGTQTACVSLLNEQYKLNYKPFYLTL